MSRAPLVAVLEDSRARGFLGPGPVDAHIDHAVALAALIQPPAGPFLDLGSGGGVPGLILATEWPGARGTLLDSSRRRCDFLVEAIGRLDVALEVRCGRAETLARDPALRGSFSLVVARGFGPPPVVAECGVGFLAEGGSLVVTEPPGARPEEGGRWSLDGLERLGLLPPEARRVGSVGAVVLRKVGPVDQHWPRREGIPRKRPVW